jgi:signal transduction histidine kinase
VRLALVRAWDLLPRPLDPIRSLKVKLCILLLGSGAAGGSYFIYATGGIPIRTATIAVLVALLTSQILAHGITSPLREMTAAARAMARGDYTRRVRTTSRDEVGELARAFNLMAGDLADADRQRRELIANVSHELRTPITALQGVLENIVDGVASPDPAAMRVALGQTERLGRLVTELLDLSRLDAGAQPMHRVPVDVGELLELAAREAAMSAGDRVAFEVRPPAAPLTVDADPARLHQVLANLLDNAARHSPPGSTVRLTGRADGDLVVFDVADEGAGIPSEQRDRMFERFTRGERAGGGGTGLGLAIARWVVQMHGGTIRVVDRPAGCLLRVSLPAGATAHPESKTVDA